MSKITTKNIHITININMNQFKKKDLEKKCFDFAHFLFVFCILYFVFFCSFCFTIDCAFSKC